MPISFARTICCTKKSDAEIYESQRHCSSASCHDLLAVAAVKKPTPCLTKIVHICIASCKTCSTLITLDYPRVSSVKKSPPNILRRPGVEGF
jgi:hypothetical protein